MQPLPIMIGYALWFVFVISWGVTARPAPGIATPGARQERLYYSVISLGLMMIVVAPFLLILPGFRMWTNRQRRLAYPMCATTDQTSEEAGGKWMRL